MLLLLWLKMKRKHFLCCLVARSADSFLIPIIINWKISPNLCKRKFPSKIFISKHIVDTEINSPVHPKCLLCCLLFKNTYNFLWSWAYFVAGTVGVLFFLSPGQHCFHGRGHGIQSHRDIWGHAPPTRRLVSLGLETRLLVKIPEQWPQCWLICSQVLPQ